MGRPVKDSTRADTRDRLLTAAEAAFGASGFARTRLEDVARDAEIRRPSLLYHFGTKEDLYAAVITRVMADLGQVMAEALSTPGEWSHQLDVLVRTFVGFLQDRPHAAHLLLREVIDGTGPGRALLVNMTDPLLCELERFISQAGDDAVPAGLPFRQAILDVVMAAMVYAASGPLREDLWRGQDGILPLARRAFIKAP